VSGARVRGQANFEAGMKSFDCKVAVVTGAGSGIGRALALQLGAAGARLALSDISRAGLDETLAMLPAGCERRGYVLDVASREAVFAHAEEVQRDFGAVDLLVNNAGTTIIGSFAHLSCEEIEWQLGINLWGVIHGCKAFLPGMLARRSGTIVNLSSIFGVVTVPGQSAYHISKFGVRGLTECLWSELEGTGVNAVLVHPGGVRTSIAKVARYAAAADQAEREMQGEADAMLVTPPEEVARDILAAVLGGRRRVLTARGARLMWWIARLFPQRYPAILRALRGKAGS
jgi:short-subunit dehydrogenase